MTQRRFEAVVFDLDGTLLDTLTDIGESANEVLLARGWPTHEIHAYRRFIGHGVPELMRRAAPEGTTDEVIGDCTSAFAAVYQERWHRRSRPYPGIEPLIERLRAADVKMSVLSNKPHAFTCRYVEHFFPVGTFAVVFGQRSGVPVKPEPQALQEILRTCRTAATNAVMLGDSAVDIATAVNAGVTAIGAGWGFRGADELHRAGAERVIDEPAQLWDVIVPSSEGDASSD